MRGTPYTIGCEGMGTRTLRRLADACVAMSECTTLDQLKHSSARMIGEVLHADCVVLGLIDQRAMKARADTIVTWCTERGFLDLYLKYFHAFDPCLSFHEAQGAPIYNLSQVMAERLPRSQEFLADFLKPQGITKGMLLWSHHARRELAVTGLWRGSDMTDFTPAEAAAGEVLATILAASLERFAAELPGATPAGCLGIPPHYGLTSREVHVAALACRGLSNKEIANRLQLTPNTIETHLKSIYRKCQVRRRTELACVLFGSSSAHETDENERSNSADANGER